MTNEKWKDSTFSLCDDTEEDYSIEASDTSGNDMPNDVDRSIPPDSKQSEVITSPDNVVSNSSRYPSRHRRQPDFYKAT